MRRSVDQSDRAKLLHQPAALFEGLRTEGFHRQPLLLQHIDVAEEANRVFSHRQPIGPLPVIAKKLDIHLAEKFADKRRTEVGMMIKQSRVARTWSRSADVARDNFS